MSTTAARRIFGIFLLLISIALLAWSMWPLAGEIRTVPIEPTYMQLPTPQGGLPAVFARLAPAPGWAADPAWPAGGNG